LFQRAALAMVGDTPGRTPDREYPSLRTSSSVI
jgi:hypothetical protein